MTTKIAMGKQKSARLVSFENSNSWIKRYDEEGALLIQAGYSENPNAYAHSDDENPIVITGSSNPRWYGEIACGGAHTKLHGRSKIETARECFAATLRPSDDGRDLIVIASHWDKPALNSLSDALTGQYRIVRNGIEICTTVTQVLPVLEGVGSYYAVADRLKPGATLLIEIGFGTSEQFILNSKGVVTGGKTVDAFGISKLCQAIAEDQNVRSLASDNSDAVSLSLISRALQEEKLGRLSIETWKAIKGKYGGEFLRNLQGHLRTQFAEQKHGIENIILTGGGGAFLQSIQPKVNQVFVIPENPQIASVKGSYDAQWAKVGV